MTLPFLNLNETHKSEKVQDLNDLHLVNDLPSLSSVQKEKNICRLIYLAALLCFTFFRKVSIFFLNQQFTQFFSFEAGVAVLVGRRQTMPTHHNS